MMKVSVVIPSKGRPAQVAQCVRRLFETTRGHDVECVIVCDEDAAFNSTMTALAETFGNDEADRMARENIRWAWATLPAIPAFNEGLRLSTGDVIMPGNDDLVWRDGWLTEALAVLETLPDGDGVVGLNDLCPIPRNFSAFFIATRRWLARENGGVLFCPHYHHNFPDPEVCARAIASGRYVVAEKAVVEHHHPVWGTAEMDATYRAGAAHFAEDQALYEMRWAAGFPDDFAPVIPVPKVYWAVPRERMIYDRAALALERVAAYCELRGYIQIQAAYAATDASREMFTRMFEQMSESPDDVLVMLDNDHDHGDDTVERLAQVGNVGVVSALCRRRGDAFDAMIYRRNKTTGLLDQIAQWPENTVIPVDMGGAGAIAVRRWVFDRLHTKYNQKYWLWRYSYNDNSSDRPGEEIYFWRMCEEAGIPTACHTGVVCPHLFLTTVEKILAVAEAAAKGEDWKKCL
jgi:glycosyltransferase involved in cell wall biosynthesis